MKKHPFLRFRALMMVAVLLLPTLCSCQDPHQSDPIITPTDDPTQEEDSMEKISLDGDWKFYQDSRAKTGRLPAVEKSQVPTLRAGETAELSLNVLRAEELYYAKLCVSLTFGEDIVTEGGAPAAIFTQINDGAWYRTEIEDLKYNQKSREHTVDASMYFGDLVAGENTVRVRSNVIDGDIALSELVSFPVSLCYYPVLMFDDMLSDICMPGVWETQLGAEYTNYNGTGWYQKTFDLPLTGEGKQYVLNFTGIDYYAEIWLNDHFIRSHEDGYSSTVIDLSEYSDCLQQKDNRLVVRVTDQDTRENAQFPIKETLAGFFHDSVGINYAGIWNDVFLQLRGDVRVEDVTVVPDIHNGETLITARVINTTARERTVSAQISISDEDGRQVATGLLDSLSLVGGGTLDARMTLTVENVCRWEIAAPYLYTVSVCLMEEGREQDTYTTSFGYTDVDTQDGKLLFNDRVIQLNGVLSWLGNWDQISPRFDPQVFTSQIRALKENGFNAIKFCLVVPPEYLLDICDREGIYVYIEYPVWNPVQTSEFYERAYSQMRRFIAMGKNHPSVVMSDFNCEMQTFDDDMLAFMNYCVQSGKEIDAVRLFADNSSTGRQNYEGDNDFWTWHPYTNALGFSDYAKQIVAARTAHGLKPVVFGEYADYPALADYETIREACGGRDPWNWSAVDDPFRADRYLASIGYSEQQIEDLIAYSRQNCVDMKMYYVQETKKAEGVSAYFLTLIQDIGHSVAGFFDELGTPKFTKEQTSFLRETVLLMDKNRYSFTGGQTNTVTPAISHYDGNTIENGVLTYEVTDDAGKTVATGELERNIQLENGCYHTFSPADIVLPAVNRATHCTLHFRLSADDGYETESQWDIYVYPESSVMEQTVAQTGKSVMVSGSGSSALMKRCPSVTAWRDGANPDLLIVFGSLTPAQQRYLKDGGKVLYFGTGSEAVKVEKGTFYSQYVLIHFPQESHPVVTALDSKGYGGLQFLNLQTEYVITEEKDTPREHSMIAKLLLRDNVGDIGQSGSYMSEFEIGEGKLIQSTLNLQGDPILGNYLIDIAADYLLQLP